MTVPVSPQWVEVASAPMGRTVYAALRWLAAGLMIVLAVLLVLPPLLGYPRYEVRAGILTVRSLATQRTVTARTPVQLVTLPPLTRRMGSGSAQTCVGRYRDAGGHEYELYTDCSSSALLFRAAGRRPLAITPGDPQALLTTLRTGGTATFHLPTQPVSPETWLSAAPLVLLAVLAVWPWPPLSYRLTPDALLVRRRLGVDRLPYATLSVRPARSRLGLRLMGTGLPGYHTGLYATAEGQVLAAATSVQAPALLLTSGGTTYYLTPADPRALMAELSRRGATLQSE